MEFAVNAVKVATPGSSDSPPGGEYIAIAVGMKNISKSPIQISGTSAMYSGGNFALGDVFGKNYDPARCSCGVGPPPNGVVSPGGLLAGTLVYDVPKGSQLVLVFTPDVSDPSASAYVDLGTI